MGYLRPIFETPLLLLTLVGLFLFAVFFAYRALVRGNRGESMFGLLIIFIVSLFASKAANLSHQIYGDTFSPSTSDSAAPPTYEGSPAIPLVNNVHRPERMKTPPQSLEPPDQEVLAGCGDVLPQNQPAAEAVGSSFRLYELNGRFFAVHEAQIAVLGGDPCSVTEEPGLYQVYTFDAVHHVRKLATSLICKPQRKSAGVGKVEHG